MIVRSLLYLDVSLRDSAQEWANQLSLECVDGSEEAANTKAQQAFIRERCMLETDQSVLVLDGDGLALHSLIPPDNHVCIRSSFHNAAMTYRRMQGGGKRQMIAKAVGLKNNPCPYVLDATAGLGKDAFVLASVGCRVTLLERIPCIHALLEDALERAHYFGAAEDPSLLEILNRMQLMCTDSISYMNTSTESPDVIYLDPMFPKRTKSAQVKKEMQVFQKLIGADGDAASLLKSALQFAKHRVVVKRPRTAAPLSELDPSYSLNGKRNRYDVYLLERS